MTIGLSNFWGKQKSTCYSIVSSEDTLIIKQVYNEN